MARAIVDVKSISETPTGLELWNRLEFTDKNFTKPIPGKFKGTAVDPVYNLKRVTEQLGPVGFAWGWKVLNERLDTFGTGDHAVTMHSLTVRAWFAQENGSIREVDHIGHTKVAYMSRGRDAYWVIDEEFGKKSLTDALSKIMMSLGASADIWLGRFDGNKYAPPEPEQTEPKTQRDRPKTNGNANVPTVEAGLMRELVHIADEHGEVRQTTSHWPEAFLLLRQAKAAAKNKIAVGEANLEAARTVLAYMPEQSESRIKLDGWIREIEAALLPGTAE